MSRRSNLNRQQSSMNREDDVVSNESSFGAKGLLNVPDALSKRTMSALAKSTQTGLNFIFENDWLQRTVWIIVLMIGIIMTLMQVKVQLSQYADSPISTNIDIEFGQNLTFPAIAICNQNQFRLSVLYKYNATELIRELSTDRLPADNHNTPGYDAFLNEVSDLDSRFFLTEAAQLKERIILRCRWPDQSLCTAKDFQLIATDMGICFAINTNKIKPRLATQAGLQGAMQLIINTEKYENVDRTCSLDSGNDLFVVIYNQSSVPLVRQSGINVPTGFTTNIALSTKKRNAIPIEYGGTCLEKQPLQYFGQELNGFTACALDKALAVVANVCNCEAYNAPLMHANLTTCTVKQHFDCVIRQFKIPQGIQKKCFSACSTREFISSQTVTSLSSKILMGDTHNATKKNRDQKTFKSPTRQKRENDENEPEVRENSLKPRTWKCPTSLIPQEQNIQIQSTFLHVTEIRHRYQADLADAIAEQIQAIKDTGARLTELGYAPIIAEYLPMFQRLSTNISCFGEFVQDSNLTAMMDSFEVDGPVTGSSLAEMLRILTKDERLLGLNNRELTLLREDDPEKYKFAHDTVTNVTKALTMVYSPYRSDLYKDINRNLTIYVDLIDLVDNYTNHNMMLKDLADTLFGAANFPNYYDHDLIEVLYDSVQQDLAKGLQDALLDSEDSPLSTLAEILHNDTLLSLATYIKFATVDTKKTEEVRDFLKRIYNCSTGALREGSKELLEEFQTAYTDYYNALTIFKEGIEGYLDQFKFDREFVEENILAVNIYFQDLSVEVYTQELTYSIWSLFCDIGGALGLFIGASLLTVVELIWLCGRECIRYRGVRREERRNSIKFELGSKTQEKQPRTDSKKNHVHPASDFPPSYIKTNGSVEKNSQRIFDDDQPKLANNSDKTHIRSNSLVNSDKTHIRSDSLDGVTRFDLP